MNLALDTETTGIIKYHLPISHESQPRIVQLGARLTDSAGRVKGELNVLIKPDGWTIPEEASAVHGITTKDCENFGIPIKSALGILNLWLILKPRIIAHNLDFDAFLIGSECARLGKQHILDGLEKYCTMKASVDLVKIPKARGGFKWPKLMETYEFLFKEKFEGAHDAMADVRACERCFYEIVKLKPETLTPQAVPAISPL